MASVFPPKQGSYRPATRWTRIGSFGVLDVEANDEREREREREREEGLNRYVMGVERGKVRVRAAPFSGARVRTKHAKRSFSHDEDIPRWPGDLEPQPTDTVGPRTRREHQAVGRF
jgi:hypothetical protein